MADVIVPRDVAVRLTRQANLHAYAQLGLHPDNSNPNESQMREIVEIGDRKYEQLKSAWIRNQK